MHEEEDPFSLLTLDVALVLEKHGYGEYNPAQLEELRAHLHHLLHGDPDGCCDGGVA